MEIIETNNKQHKILVSKEDYNNLKKYKWHINKTGYPATNIKIAKNKWKTMLLHNFLFVTNHNMVIDHINCNKLDNRRENLRLCSRTENNRNTFKKSKINKYKGVGFDKRKNKFRARIMVDYQEIWLGYYKTEKEAAIAYNLAALKYFGNFANLNKIEG